MDITYILAESLRGFKQNKLMSFAAISIITISLLFMGIFIVSTINVRQIIEIIKNKVEIEVFIKDEVKDEEEINNIHNLLNEIKGIQQIDYISREQAVEEFKKEFGEEMLEAVEFNPFPASFQIRVHDKDKSRIGIEGIVEMINRIKGVEEIKYGREWLPFLDKIIIIFFLIDISIGTLITVVSVFIVSNTIKLTVFARKNIIEIMKLTGATDNFIRLPFFLEGIIHGLLGGIIAASLLFLLFGYLKPYLPNIIFMKNNMLLVCIGLGILLGGCGSWTSIQKFLKL